MRLKKVAYDFEWNRVYVLGFVCLHVYVCGLALKLLETSNATFEWRIQNTIAIETKSNVNDFVKFLLAFYENLCVIRYTILVDHFGESSASSRMMKP